MKRTQKLFSVLLSFVMLAALAQPAWAGEFNNDGIFENHSDMENSGAFANRGYLLNEGDFANAAEGTLTNYAYRIDSAPISGTVHDSFSAGQGGAIHCEIDGETLTISGSGSMPRFASSGEYNGSGILPPWERYTSTITELVIEEGVTSVGAFAFSNFHSLRRVSLPSTLTAVGDNAFRFCTALESVTLPESLKVIGDSAFYACTGLSTVTIPAGVTAVGAQVFGCCSGLKEIAVAAGNTAYASVDGVLLTKDLTTLVAYPCAAGLASSADAFHAEYAVPESVTTIGPAAFEGALLTAITLPESVTAIGEFAFENSYLQSIELPANVSAIPADAFRYCTLLTAITLPESVTSIGENAFSESALASVNYSGSSEQFAALLSGAAAGNEPLSAASVYYVGSKDVVFIAGADAAAQTFRCVYRDGTVKFLPAGGLTASFAHPGWYQITYGAGMITALRTLSESESGGFTAVNATLAAADPVSSCGALSGGADTAYLLLDDGFQYQGTLVGDESANIVPTVLAGTWPYNAYYLCDGNAILAAVIVGKAEGVSADYDASFRLETVNGEETGRLLLTLTLPNETAEWYTVMLPESGGTYCRSFTGTLSSANNTLVVSNLAEGVYTRVQLYRGTAVASGTLVLDKTISDSLKSVAVNEATPLGTTVSVTSGDSAYTFNGLLPGYVYIADGLFPMTAEDNVLETGDEYASFTLRAERWSANDAATGYVLRRCQTTEAIPVSGVYDANLSLETVNGEETGRLLLTLTLPNETGEEYTVALVNENGVVAQAYSAWYSRTANTVCLSNPPADVYTGVRLYKGYDTSTPTLLLDKQLNGPLTVTELDEATKIDETAAAPIVRQSFDSGHYQYAFHCLLPGYSYTADSIGGITAGKNSFVIEALCTSFALTAEKWSAGDTAGSYVLRRYRATDPINVVNADATYFFVTGVNAADYLAYGIQTSMVYDGTPQSLDDNGYKLSESANLPAAGYWYSCAWSDGDLILTAVPEAEVDSQGVYHHVLTTEPGQSLTRDTLSAQHADGKTVYYIDTQNAVTACTGNTLDLAPSTTAGYFTVDALFNGTVFQYAVVKEVSAT